MPQLQEELCEVKTKIASIDLHDYEFQSYFKFGLCGLCSGTVCQC